MINQATKCKIGDLNELIEESSTYLSSADKSEYPISSLENLKDALTNAIKASKKEPCEETEINKAKKNLNISHINIKNNKRNVFVLPEIDNTYDFNSGFFHSGGIYVQKDINGVKKQLEEKNEKVTATNNILKKVVYAQSDGKTQPKENIVRGGNEENFLNAARGASMTFQNALRWKIEGNELCAKHEVEVLMDWATTTKLVTGETKHALATGLYGYKFAQTAILNEGL